MKLIANAQEIPKSEATNLKKTDENAVLCTFKKQMKTFCMIDVCRSPDLPVNLTTWQPCVKSLTTSNTLC